MVCLKTWQASSPKHVFFLLERNRVPGGQRRVFPGSERPAPVRPAQPSRRLQAPGQGSPLPHRDPDGGRRHSPFVLRLLLRSGCRAAPRLRGTDTRLVLRCTFRDRSSPHHAAAVTTLTRINLARVGPARTRIEEGTQARLVPSPLSPTSRQGRGALGPRGARSTFPFPGTAIKAAGTGQSPCCRFKYS